MCIMHRRFYPTLGQMLHFKLGLDVLVNWMQANNLIVNILKSDKSISIWDHFRKKDQPIHYKRTSPYIIKYEEIEM